MKQQMFDYGKFTLAGLWIFRARRARGVPFIYSGGGADRWCGTRRLGR